MAKCPVVLYAWTPSARQARDIDIRGLRRGPAHKSGRKLCGRGGGGGGGGGGRTNVRFLRELLFLPCGVRCIMNDLDDFEFSFGIGVFFEGYAMTRKSGLTCARIKKLVVDGSDSVMECVISHVYVTGY